MASFEVGEAYVSLLPSGRGFSSKAKKELANVDLEASVDLDADASKLREAVKAAKADLAALDREKASPSLEFEASVGEAKIAEVKAKLDELSKKEATPKVATQTAEAQRDLAALERKLADIDARRATVDVDAEIAEGQARLAQFEAKLNEIDRRRAQPVVTADVSRARSELDSLNAKLSALSTRRATPQVALQIAQAQQEALRIRAELDRLGSMRATPQVNADTAALTAKLAVVNQQLSQIDGRRVSANVDASGSGRASLILYGIVAALGAVAAAAPAAAAALAAVSGAAGALGQGAAAAIAGFSGIGDALKAVEADEKSAATTSAASGSTRANAAKQVASAQRALGQAQTQADRAAITGAQQVAQAQSALGQARVQQTRTAVQGAQQVADAERSLARAVQAAARVRVSAAQQVASAERSLENAQRSRMYAQEALTRAVQDATRANRDLQMSVAGAALSEERAALSLAQARQRLAESSATGLERQDLELGVREAEQNLKEVQTRYGDLRGEQAEWARTGVMGSRQVVDATRGVADAQRGVQDAQRGLTEAQVSGAQQVADAQANVADAQMAVGRAAQSAAWANQDAAQAVSEAQAGVAQAVQQSAWAQQDAARGVEDAQRALADAYTQGGAAAAAGSNQAAYALGKLTPAGRSFVNFLKDEWQPAWKRVTDSVADQMLPRVETAMRNLLKLEPLVKQGLSDSGRIIGDLAVAGSQLATSPPFQQNFASIMASNNRQLENYGRAGINLFGAFTDLYTVAGPVAERFSRLAEYSTQAFESWIIGQRATGELGNSLQSAGDTLMWLGGVLIDVGAAVWDVAQGLAPLGATLLEMVRNTAVFVGELATWSPTLTSITVGAGLAAVAIGRLNTALAFKALTTGGVAAAGFAGNLKTLLVPSLLAATDGMQAFGQRATNAAQKVGVSEGAASRFGGALTKVGGSLPVIGAALIATGIAYDTFTTSTKEATEAVTSGQMSFATLAKELEDQTVIVNASRAILGDWAGDLVGKVVPGAQQAAQAIHQQIQSMTQLQQMQTFATIAQKAYEDAVRQFGENSPQAIAAQRTLANSTNNVEQAQEAARRATMNATQALQDQQSQILGSINARLGFEQSVRGTARAQDEYTRAVRESGAGSTEAQDALGRLQESQTAQAQAAMRAADQEARRRGETDTSRAQTEAYARSIRDMVAASDGELSPALQQMVQGLDLAGLSAAGARVNVDAAGRSVATFPDGKTVVLDANTSLIPGQIAAVKGMVDSTRGTIGVDANPGPGVATVGGFKLGIDQTTGTVTVNGNITPADQARLGIQAKTDGTTGTMFIDGNPVPCDGSLNGMRVRVDRTTGVMTIEGNPNPAVDAGNRAEGDIANNRPVMPVDADTSFAKRAFNAFLNALPFGIGIPFKLLLSGGGLVPEFASGGTVRGPGTATSDSIPAMLSAGEYVVRARSVSAVGVGTLDAINRMAKGGPVGFAAGGKARPEPAAVATSAASAPAAPEATAEGPVAPTVDASAQAAATGTTTALTAALAAQAAVVNGQLVPALALQQVQTAAVTAQQLPLATNLTGVVVPALAQTVLANQGLQLAQTGTQLSTTATALNTAVNSTAMTAAMTAMSQQGQFQHAMLRQGQLNTQLSTNQTALNALLNNQNMTLTTTGMSTQSQFQHQALRTGQLQTQLSQNQTALNTASNNQNMIATTANMSAVNQGHLASLRGAQGVTQQATTVFADAWRAQLARTMPDSANPLRYVINTPMRSVTDAWNNLDGQFALGKRVNPYVANFARGGFSEDHRPQITSAGGPTRIWSEPETGGEAYIPMGQQKRARSTGILSQVADRFGLGVVPKGDLALFADGGVTKYAHGSMLQFADGGLWRRLGGVAQQLIPGTSVSSGYRPGDPGYHGKGQAADLVGNLPRINQVLADRYPNSTQLIYTPGRNIFQGRPHTYNAATRADHFDHVHWAMQSEAMLNGAPGMYAGGAGGAAAFDPTPAINAAFAKAYKEIDDIPRLFGGSPQVARDQGIARFSADKVKEKATADLMAKFAAAAMGATSNEAPGIVKIISDVARGRFGGQARKAAITGTATGLVESNLRNLPGGDRDSVGVFQQRPSMGWGSVAQLMNVTYAAGKFFSRFPGNWASMDQGALAQSVQRSAFPAKYGQRMGQATGLVAQYGGFDNGGLVAPGNTLVQNNTGAPERILDNVETRNYDTLSRLMGRGGMKVDPASASGGGPAVVQHIYPRAEHSETKVANRAKTLIDFEMSMR